MGVPYERFQQGDVFIDYDLEEVMFRYESSSHRCLRKFYGESTEDEVLHDNRLLNDAMRFGDEIDSRTYEVGKTKG